MRSLAIGVALLFSSAARAHGPDLGVTEILTWSGSGAARTPRLVRLTRGVAIHDGGALAFVCPSRWGGPEAPQLALLGDDVWIAGWYGPARIGPDAALERIAGPADLMNGKARALASDGHDVLALTTTGALWRVGPDAPSVLWSTTPFPDAIVAIGPGQWMLASEDAGTLTLTRLTTSGAVVAEPVLTAPYRATPTLVRAGDTLWVRGLGVGVYRLDRVTLEDETPTLVAVATSGTPIFGPVTSGGETYVILGGQPRRLVGDVALELPETPRLFCLHAHEGLGLVACDGPDLKRYDPTSGLGETLLAVSALTPPSIDGLDATDTFGCRAEWEDVVRDTGLTGQIGEVGEGPESSDVERDAERDLVDEPANRGDDSGCAGSGGGVLGLLGLWLASPFKMMDQLGRRRGVRAHNSLI